MSKHLLGCLRKDLVSLSHTQCCLCSFSITLPYFHTLAASSYIGTYTLASCFALTLLIQGTLPCWSLAFPISTANNYFKNGEPSLKFGFITYLPYFFQLVTSFMSLWFLIFFMVYPKTWSMLFINLEKSFSISFFALVFNLVFSTRLHPLVLFKSNNLIYFFWT